MYRQFAALAVLALAALTSPLRAASPVEGVWLTEKRQVGVELYSCGERLCGKIVWLAKPRWSEGTLKLDERNPDPALRGRHWCGIEVISDLRPRNGNWVEGRFYYPKDGNNYDIEIRPKENGTLTVRAYKGLKIFGKSEVWTRAEKPLPGCEAAEKISGSN